MSKRGKKLISKIFQLKIAFKILGIIILSYLIFIAITGAYAIRKQKENITTVEELKKSVTMEDDIITAFIKYTRRNMSIHSGEILYFKKIKEDHKESLDTINKHIESLENSSQEFFYLLGIVTVIIILLSVLAFIYLIRLTHRMSGPIYVIEQHIDTILKGEKPEFRELRKRDEFKDFYSKFIELSGKLNDK